MDSFEQATGAGLPNEVKGKPRSNWINVWSGTKLPPLEERFYRCRSRDRRAEQRRQRLPLPSVAIVGYTNAGKSTLLNQLTGADAVSEDKLFATLDPTSRRLKLPSGRIIVLTDTVGFIRKLPHRLVDSFKATLEEALVADLIIHLVDLSSPEYEAQMQTTDRVLKELGAIENPLLTVYNKIDQIPDDIEKIRAKEFQTNLFLLVPKPRRGFPLYLIDWKKSFRVKAKNVTT